MADARDNDASNFAKMVDKLPVFDPPDNNSAGAIALRAWVRGVTARRPPALAFLRKYEGESFARTYDSFLPSGDGSKAKKDHLARALMYATETRMAGTAQVFVDLLIQVKGDISAKVVFLALMDEYKAGDASDVRRDLAAPSANAHGGLRTTQLRLRVLANQHKIGANSFLAQKNPDGTVTISQTSTQPSKDDDDGVSLALSSLAEIWALGFRRVYAGMVKYRYGKIPVYTGLYPGPFSHTRYFCVGLPSSRRRVRRGCRGSVATSRATLRAARAHACSNSLHSGPRALKPTHATRRPF